MALRIGGQLHAFLCRRHACLRVFGDSLDQNLVGAQAPEVPLQTVRQDRARLAEHVLRAPIDQAIIRRL